MMNVLKVTGGNALRGVVDVPGSKNAALAILSAVLLGKGRSVLHNVPDVRDIHIKLDLLRQYGAQIAWHENTVEIDCTELHHAEVGEEMVRPIRTSFYIVGSLLARLGKVTLPAPGGCKIGARPVDFHVKGLRLLGAQIDLEGGVYHGHVNELKGTEIYLDFPSAGATQHLMATACLAHGCTTIQNAALEPEIVALAEFLIGMGARIEGAGTSTITVIGVEELRGCEFRVPSDRLQASTYLLAGAITRGDVTVRGILPEDQTALMSKLREAGLDSEEGHDWVRLAADHYPNGIRIKTMPYPGFPTDIQQPTAALFTLCSGTTVIEETIYESRIGHVSELERMGAKIMASGGRITTIEGVTHLHGAHVEASDLRAGAALVLAGLAAEGDTTIRNVHYIDRGYERLEEIIRSLGGTIERLDEDMVGNDIMTSV